MATFISFVLPVMFVLALTMTCLWLSGFFKSDPSWPTGPSNTIEHMVTGGFKPDPLGLSTGEADSTPPLPTVVLTKSTIKVDKLLDEVRRNNEQEERRIEKARKRNEERQRLEYERKKAEEKSRQEKAERLLREQLVLEREDRYKRLIKLEADINTANSVSSSETQNDFVKYRFVRDPVTKMFSIEVFSGAEIVKRFQDIYNNVKWYRDLHAHKINWVGEEELQSLENEFEERKKNVPQEVVPVYKTMTEIPIQFITLEDAQEALERFEKTGDYREIFEWKP